MNTAYYTVALTNALLALLLGYFYYTGIAPEFGCVAVFNAICAILSFRAARTI